MVKINFDLEGACMATHLKIAKKAFNDKMKCDKCETCCANQINYEGELSKCSDCNRVVAKIGLSLVEKVEIALAIIKSGEEITNSSEAPKCSGRCESCKNIDSDLFEKSGYLFCTYWHNFTVDKGFCYAFESKEPVETCG